MKRQKIIQRTLKDIPYRVTINNIFIFLIVDYTINLKCGDDNCDECKLEIKGKNHNNNPLFFWGFFGTDYSRTPFFLFKNYRFYKTDFTNVNVNILKKFKHVSLYSCNSVDLSKFPNLVGLYTNFTKISNKLKKVKKVKWLDINNVYMDTNDIINCSELKSLNIKGYLGPSKLNIMLKKLRVLIIGRTKSQISINAPNLKILVMYCIETPFVLEELDNLSMLIIAKCKIERIECQRSLIHMTFVENHINQKIDLNKFGRLKNLLLYSLEDVNGIERFKLVHKINDDLFGQIYHFILLPYDTKLGIQISKRVSLIL